MLNNTSQSLNPYSHVFDRPLHVPELALLSFVLTPLSAFLNLYSQIRFLFALQTLAGTPPSAADFTERDEYLNALRVWFENFLQALESQEASVFAGPPYRQFRESLVSDPFVARLFSVRTGGNIDVLLNNRYSPQQNSFIMRERGFQEVPIAGLLFFGCYAIASNQNIRQSVNNKIASGIKVPVILQELLNSHRVPRTGYFNVNFGFVSLPDYILDDLNIRGSIFDASYLATDLGLEAFFSFLSRISINSGCYIKMQIGRPVTLQSGETITITAINIEPITDPNQTLQTQIPNISIESGVRNLGLGIVMPPFSQAGNRIQYPSVLALNQDTVATLLPTHSYGNSVNGVHLVDSFLFGRALIFQDQDNSLNNQMGLFPLSQAVRLTVSNLNFAAYIIYRGSGMLQNSPEKSATNLANLTSDEQDTVTSADTFGNNSQQSPKFERRGSRRSAFNSKKQLTKLKAKLFVSSLASSGYITPRMQGKLLSSLNLS